MWLDDGSWIDRASCVVEGHQALMRVLEAELSWDERERLMYERRVAVPRRLGRVGEGPMHPVVAALREALQSHYQLSFCGVTFAHYRDGNDSVAWHRDRELRDWPEAVVAIVSLGGPRRFQLRPFDVRRGKGVGQSMTIRVGWGDLLVMGGQCQHRWEHGVPKMPHAEPRMAVMFRQLNPEVELGVRRVAS